MGLKVGLIRDERFLEHKPGLVHPENPNRLVAVYRMLDQDFKRGLIQIKAQPATLDQLESVHTPAYIKKVLATSERLFTNLAPDTPASSKTYLAAWLAAGSCIKGAEALLQGQCQVCFAFVRPPGHHALKNRAAGFCIYNNLGLAARYCLERLGLERILIVDYDIHHGNALQDLFYDRPEVLYLSSHYLNLYPYTGQWDEIGQGRGLGYTINLPVPKELDDQDILHLYREVLGPAARSYVPQMIMIAAGFDAHRQDPIGRTQLSEKAFEWLTDLILNLRAEVGQPPILLALEGGYDPIALTDCVRVVLKSLTRWRRPRRLPLPFTDRGQAMIDQARRAHAGCGVWTACPI